MATTRSNTRPDHQLIGDALAQLPVEHRGLVRRSYYEAKTTAQIARDLHIADTTVKATLHDAAQALLAHLREQRATP